MTVIEYKLKNIKPIKINDSNRGGTNQLETLKYITGSSVRGYVISRLDKVYLDKNKKNVLSPVTRFYNAYPLVGDEISLPSPKIYYAAKNSPDKLFSVLDRDIDGMKRADMGDFCTIADDVVNCFSTSLGETMNNNVGEKKIFRSRFISANQKFGGYIVTEETELADKIIDILKGGICIGAGISNGFGRCSCISAKIITDMPYSSYRIESLDKNREIKLMLLSDTVMVNSYGEPCGLDVEYLKSELGDFEIKRSSASVVRSLGYNNTWGCAIPSVTMYEKGSVFSLSFADEPDLEKIRCLEEKGIGIRREEGFGQIVFTDKLSETALRHELSKRNETEDELIRGVDAEDADGLNADDKAVLKQLAAKYYDMLINERIQQYVVDNKTNNFKGISKSALGNVMSMITVLKYSPLEAESKLKTFFENMSKRTESAAKPYKITERYITYIFQTNISDVLDIKDNVFGQAFDDVMEPFIKMWYKLELLENEIRYGFRKEE